MNEAASNNLIVITGPPGAGKSTAAEGVAAPRDPSVVVSGDAFFDFLRAGRIAPWTPEAHEQNRTVVKAALRAASAYAEAGMHTVVDGIFGPWFMDEILASVHSDVTIDYIVLSADEAAVRERVRGSASSAEEADLRSDVAAQVLGQFNAHSEIAAHVIDTTHVTPEEGVAAIRQGLEDGRFRLPR